MKFRPCIDIHNGKVKQIVGSSLKDEGNEARENFVAQQDAAYYAGIYRDHGLCGGHVILLNPAGSEFYEETKRQALLALSAYPGGLQVGGGVHDGNAKEYLAAGASHVIVTSYVFRDGRVALENAEKLKRAVGKEHVTLDVSCRVRDGKYYVVTDRWQKFTELEVCEETMEMLSAYCDEFLIHAVDVEGKNAGIDTDLVRLLAKYDGLPMTYAGGVSGITDLEKLKKEGRGRLDVTIGSALDLFGGKLAFTDILSWFRNNG